MCASKKYERKKGISKNINNKWARQRKSIKHKEGMYDKWKCQMEKKENTKIKCEFIWNFLFDRFLGALLAKLFGIFVLESN